MNRVPAIIRTEQRTIESLAQSCSNGLTATVAQSECWLANHDELQRRYKEKWATWEEACQSVYKMSRQAVHKRILKIAEHVSSTTVDNNIDIELEERALKKVEQAREERAPKPEPTSEPEEQEEEKPAVHSADEVKVHTNGHKPKDNGKPKTELALWKVVEEDIIGVGYRKVDDLNRVCPNPVYHKRLITALKMCHGILDEWRRDTR